MYYGLSSPVAQRTGRAEYDPSTAKFSGSYNPVWTAEQIDMIINTSVANFNNGQDTIKEALFNAWQRKKYLREQGAGPSATAVSQPQVPTPSQGPPPTQPTVQGAGSASSHATATTTTHGQPLYPRYETLPDGSPIPPPPPYRPQDHAQGLTLRRSSSTSPCEEPPFILSPYRAASAIPLLSDLPVVKVDIYLWTPCDGGSVGSNF